jgi:hypothetical protein
MTSALDGVGGQRHAAAAFTPWKDPVPIVQEAGWAPGPVWIVAENLAPTGIRSRWVRVVIPTTLSRPTYACIVLLKYGHTTQLLFQKMH